MFNLPIKILQTKKIETVQASVNFDNIDELVASWDAAAKVTSRHLVLIANIATTEPGAQDLGVDINLNGDVGANYNRQTITGIDGVASALIGNGETYYRGIRLPTSTFPNNWGGGMVLIPHAFNATNHKCLLSIGGSAEITAQAAVGRWASVAAITSLLIAPQLGNFRAGSIIHLGVVDERYLVSEITLAADGLPNFGNIPQGEGDLSVVGYARSDRAGVADDIKWVVNDDVVVGNYFRQYLLGSGAALFAGNGSERIIGSVTGDTATANAFGGAVITILRYAKNDQPTLLSQSGYHDSSIPQAGALLISARRSVTEPIYKLGLIPSNGVSFKSGSLFSLYRVPKRIIQRIELTESAATVTFDDIPQNFESIALRVYARTDRAAIDDYINVRLNSDAAVANYASQRVRGSAAATSAVRSAVWPYTLQITASAEGYREYGGGTIMFPGYSETDRHKHSVSLTVRTENLIELRSNRWLSVNAITQITLLPDVGPNFVAGSVFELEGILKKEGLPPSEGMALD